MIIKYISFLVGIIWSYSIIKTQSIFSKKTGLLFKLFISKVSWFTLIAACYFGYKNFSIKFTIIGIVLSVLIVQFSFSFIKKKLLERGVLDIKQDLNTSSIESHLNRIRKKLKKINSDFSVFSKNSNIFLE